MKPLITVIVPVRNGERTIAKCLHSLKNLNYPNYEIIVVNDGSTDRTPQILKQFDTITVLCTEGVGPSAARNLAIERAKGEFIAFTDGDCMVDREWLNQLLAYFTDSTVMGVGGDQLQPDDETAFGRDVHGFFSLIAFSSDYLKTRKEVMSIRHNPTCNMMYRSAAFKEIGYFKKDLWPCEDLEFDRRLIQAGYTLMYNPRAVVYHYRPENLKQFVKFHFRYGRAHVKLVRRYGLIEKIHYIPPLIFLLLVIETILFFYRPVIALIICAGCLFAPPAYFFIKGKNVITSFKYSRLFFATIISWTAGFIRGLADKNIWE